MGEIVARIRTIKPDFFKDEKLADLSFGHRLLFEGLWCLSDREGRLEDRPRYIKVEIFPYDDIDVDAHLKDLDAHGLICRYEINDKEYIQIPNFLKHQRPNSREPLSEIPAPEKHVIARARACMHAQDREEGKGREGKGNTNNLVELPRPVDEIFEFWKEELKHPNAKLDKVREKAIKARLDEKYTPERIKAAIRGVKFSPHHMGDNDRKTIYDEIELICRSGKNVDRFADLWVAHENKLIAKQRAEEEHRKRLEPQSQAPPTPSKEDFEKTRLAAKQAREELERKWGSKQGTK